MAENINRHLGIPVEDIIAGSSIGNRNKLCRTTAINSSTQTNATTTMDIGTQTNEVVIVYIDNGDDDGDFDNNININNNNHNEEVNNGSMENVAHNNGNNYIPSINNNTNIESSMLWNVQFEEIIVENNVVELTNNNNNIYIHEPNMHGSFVNVTNTIEQSNTNDDAVFVYDNVDDDNMYF